MRRARVREGALNSHEKDYSLHEMLTILIVAALAATLDTNSMFGEGVHPIIDLKAYFPVCDRVKKCKDPRMAFRLV